MHLYIIIIYYVFSFNHCYILISIEAVQSKAISK